MKSVLPVFACGLVLVTFISPLAVAYPALINGPSAVGRFEILPTDATPARSIEFKAETAADGQVVGEVVFKDDNPPAVTPAEEGSESKPLYLRAQFDCLVVQVNKAVMSGNIIQASKETYLGRRFLLVVQDNGGAQDPRKRDKLTWGVYRPTTKNLSLTDAERPDEAGPLSWLITDGERPEDGGAFPDNNEVVGCKTFPLSSISFLEAAHTRGSAQVRP